MELQGNATVGRQSDQLDGHLGRRGTPTVLKEERTELTAPGNEEMVMRLNQRGIGSRGGVRR